MKRFFSRQITAAWPGGGLLQRHFFDNILKNGPYDKKEDGGRDKKTSIESSPGFGSNDRDDNPIGSKVDREDKDQGTHPGLTSFYDNGDQAQDETGPGFSQQPANPYFGVDMNEFFLQVGKGNSDRDSIPSSQAHLRKLLDADPITPPHKRYNVDK
jgi:hypothetical protein